MITLEYILEENKKGSSRFLEYLKRGDRVKLNSYFEIAKKNNINLFEYTSKSESPVDAIIKLINKDLKEKNKEEYVKYLDDLFFYLKENGFNLYLDNFSNIKSKEYPYLSNYYFSESIKNEINSNLNIYDYLLEFSKKNEGIAHIKNPENLINNATDDYIINNVNYKKYLKKLYENDSLENIFNIKPVILKKISTGKEKVFDINNEIRKKLNSGIIERNLIDYIIYEMTIKGNNNFLINLVKKDKKIQEKIEKIILSPEKFNMDMSVKLKGTEDYEKVEQYSFLKDYTPQNFWNYLNKIILFNEKNPGNKMKFKEEINNPDNYIKIISYFYFLKINLSDLNLNNTSDVKNILDNVNLSCNKDLLPSIFKNKSGLHAYEDYVYQIGEWSYLIDNWIKKDDVKRNIGKLRLEELSEYNLRDMSGNNYGIRKVNSKIFYLINENKEYICDLMDNQKVSVNQKIFN